MSKEKHEGLGFKETWRNVGCLGFRVKHEQYCRKGGERGDTRSKACSIVHNDQIKEQ